MEQQATGIGACRTANHGRERGLIEALGVPFGPYGAALLETPSVVLWQRHCPLHAPESWEFERACHWTFLAVPWTPMAIRQEGREEFVADPNLVMLYNRGQMHSRRALSPRGDRSVVISLSDELAAEIIATIDADAPYRARGPLPFSHAPSEASDFLAHLRLLEQARRGTVDPLGIQERCIGFVHSHIRRAYACMHTTHEIKRRRRSRSDTIHAWRDLAERTKALLAETYTMSMSLDEIARRVHSSPFHLLRVFRAHTSRTLHAYRNELRLREGMLRIAAGCNDISRLGVELGYASHSHFTSSFTRLYGLPPSQVRGSERLARVAPPNGTTMSKRMKVHPPSVA